MKEYQTVMDECSNKIYAVWSRTIPYQEWGNKKVAEGYLRKYWLPKAEYETLWKPKQDAIFINQENPLPSMVFAKGYNIIALIGGCLFEESDFRQLQECILAVGDKHIVIIENSFGGKSGRPALRMKFPADISWEELGCIDI